MSCFGCWSLSPWTTSRLASVDPLLSPVVTIAICFALAYCRRGLGKNPAPAPVSNLQLEAVPSPSNFSSSWAYVSQKQPAHRLRPLTYFRNTIAVPTATSGVAPQKHHRSTVCGLCGAVPITRGGKTVGAAATADECECVSV